MRIRFAAIMAALFVCAPAAAQRVNALPVASGVTPTDQVVGMTGAGCNSATPTGTQTPLCVLEKIPLPLIASYVAIDPALTAAYQPIDADLTSLSQASATNAIYYRSAANTWLPITIGANLTFAGGTLSGGASGGTVTSFAFTNSTGVSGTVTTASTQPNLMLTLAPNLTAIAGLGTGVDQCGYWTGAATAALYGCPAFGRSLVASASASAAQTTLGLGSAALASTGTGGHVLGYLDGANTYGGAMTFSQLVTGSISGNAGTATKLATARAINGVAFDGTTAITINAADSTTRLAAASNLSDVASPSAARGNLGLGTAAIANTGTSGATLPLLSTANSWSGTQTYTAAILSAASVAGAAGFNIPAGTAPTTPNTGDLWMVGGALNLFAGGVANTIAFTTSSISGNAATATKLSTGRTVSITGDLSYTSAALDGTNNVTGTGTLTASGVTAGTYGGASGSASITFDAKGRSTGASTVTLGVAGGGTGRTTSMPILSVSRSNGSTSFVTVANSFTTIVLNTVAIDTASSYNTATGIYTLPETGIYLITSKLRLADNVAGGTSYGIGVDTANQDGASFFWAVTPSSMAQARQGVLNFRVYSGTAGDQLRLFAYVDNTSGLGVIAAELNMYRVR